MRTRILMFITLLTLLPLVILTPGLLSHAQTIPIQREQIRKYEVFATINQEGTVSFTEYITYDFPTERHGIIREIPFIKTNAEGERLIMEFTDFSVNDDQTGTPVKFTKSVSGDSIVLKIGDENVFVLGRQVYVIRYKVAGAITYFSDHDELYWNAVGTGWGVPVLQSSAEISVPAQLPVGDLQAVCYTGSTGSTESDCRIDITYERGTAVIISNRTLNPGEGLTATIGFPKNIVDVLEPQKEYPSLIRYLILGLVGIAAILWYIVYPVRVFIHWYRDYKASRSARIVAAWFDPPKDKTGNFLIPAETSALLDKTVDHKDITATVIHLAQKGYIKVKEVSEGVFSLTLPDQITDTGTLTPPEKSLLDKIRSLAKNGGVKISELGSSTSFGKEINEFKDKVAEDLVTRGIFKDNPQKTHNKYMGIGLLGLFFMFNIPVLFSSIVFGRKSAHRTEWGIEKYGEARSLKNFLVSQDEQLDFQAKNQMFFEKLLPYATAFGVEGIWAKRFSDIQMIKPDWYEGDTFKTGFYVNFARNLTTTSRSAHASHVKATSTSSSSGFSSGFSGGSSGGGGGGGGGRSW
jgi:uncharacterized membrane protein